MKKKVILFITVTLTLSACKESTIEVPPEKGLQDFFPLKTGNAWYYTYAYDGPYGSYIKKGKLTWIVIGKNSMPGRDEFTIQGLFTGIAISHPIISSNQYDTVYYTNTAATFSVIYTNNDTVSSGSDIETNAVPIIYIAPFRRHNDTTATGSVLKIKVPARWYSYETIKARLGLTEYYTNDGLFGNYYQTHIVLDSVNFK